MPDLRILCWEGYEDNAFLAPFEARAGCRVAGEHFLSDAAAVEQVSSASGGGVDIVNLNSPYAQKLLHPGGRLLSLEGSGLDPGHELMPELLAPLYARAHASGGAGLIGVGQRFGPFNLVVNADRISAYAAADQGFDLPNDPRNAGRYGILEFPDFNILHICFGAGVDPFRQLGELELEVFSKTARSWFDNAAMITGDHVALNAALAKGNIDFYVSGGRFSSAAARAEGNRRIQAVTPRHGPVRGKGAVMFMEITSVLARSALPETALDFLRYLLEPETAHAIACHPKVCNPVVQMADPDVLKLFSPEQLEVIQWDTLEEELSHCVELDIPPDAEELGRLLQSSRNGRPLSAG